MKVVSGETFAKLIWSVTQETSPMPRSDKASIWTPDHPIIQAINQVEIKREFLKNINKLYTLRGWKDTAVFSSSRFTYPGMDAEFPGKVTEINYDGTSHTGRNGITQDPRVIADIVRILTDFPFGKTSLNYGELSRA